MPPPGEPKNIRLWGPAWQPPGYATAPLAERRWYWKQLGDIALEIKRDEVSRGIGITGRPLKPVIQKYRRDGATGPPLIPHEFQSRTQRLLAVHLLADGVTLFWRAHGQKSWSTILGYHAYKHGARSLPVRNTIGVSRGGQTKIRKRAFAAWEARAKEEPPPKPKPVVPKPKPAPKPKPVAKPPPAPKYKVVTELPKRITKPIVFSGKLTPPPPPKPPRLKPPPPPPKPKPAPKPPAPPPEPKPPASPIDSAITFAASRGIEATADAAHIYAGHGQKADRILAVYNNRKDAIFINERHASWSDPAAFMEAQRTKEWFSSNHPEHIIFHEVGHALHYRAIGEQGYLDLKEHFTSAAEFQTARKLSRYAMENTSEFVAEAYAAMSAGRKLDDDVLKLYEKLGGPAVKL